MSLESGIVTSTWSVENGRKQYSSLTSQLSHMLLYFIEHKIFNVLADLTFFRARYSLIVLKAMLRQTNQPTLIIWLLLFFDHYVLPVRVLFYSETQSASKT